MIPNTGNLSSKAGVGYTYNPANKPHAVRSLTGWSFSYDDRGNMTRRVNSPNTYDLAYDVESRLVQVKLNSAVISSFLYDGDGNRAASLNEYQNLAAGAPVSSDVTLGNADVATNGDTWANSGSSSSREFANATSGLHYAQVDLGAAHPVDKVIVWHYAADGRTYHGTKVQVSADGTNWDTMFSSNSTPPSEYPETAAGKTITFSSRQVRYVRDWLNGSTSNAYNHWVEIEAWGKATTAYVGNYFEWHGSTTTMVKYYGDIEHPFAGGQRVAMRQGNGTGVSQLYWLLSDHLGGSAMQVDAVNANLLTDLRYKPWGEARSGDRQGDTPTDFQYTGQRIDSGLGLYYYGARWYDPMLGRFIQPDTVVPLKSQGVQAWDRYAYVNNSPVNLNDPTGHSAPLPPSPFSSINIPVSNGWDLIAAVVCFFACGVLPVHYESYGLGQGAIVGDKAPKMALPTIAGVYLSPEAAAFNTSEPIKTTTTSSSPSSSSPDFIGTKNGDLIPVPDGAAGPTTAENGAGFQYTGGSGGKGLSPKVTTVRIMDPTTPKPPSPGYPNGYVSYSNASGQTVHPYTGQTVARNSQWWHIRLGKE